MQLVINASEVTAAREQQLFSGRSFYVFIYNEAESVSGLHQYDYYEFTLVLTGRYFQKTSGKHVLPERSDFAFIPLGPHHQSFYRFDATRILNVGVSERLFEQHYLPLLPYYFVASQVYQANNAFLICVETVISSSNFRETGLERFAEMVTFYVVNRLRHYREEQAIDDISQWLRSTIEKIHDKEQFNESVLESMVTLSAKSQEYLIRAAQRYYGKAPMQTINKICINLAKRQLEMTNYSVTDIVFEAGYSSPSLLIRAFRKLTSFTPKNYRKKLTEFSQ